MRVKVGGWRESSGKDKTQRASTLRSNFICVNMPGMIHCVCVCVCVSILIDKCTACGGGGGSPGPVRVMSFCR